ncbi:uncharacterized protein PAC_10520 [Phialocephala subalpina]|uniref:Isomerase YraM n=1 Tax=Phialocephala subalpina TaxID=576137 RepID=A0A1L7X6J0_9HELO|nr:uncharacterized protein PAC_10520 [Phialocephala subalpina]
MAQPTQIAMTAKLQRGKTRHVLPSVWMRAGTSKGLFIKRKHLPASESEWPAMLLAAMGSSESCPRQLDGVGGATSTTSKVAVIAESSREDIDVDYTFIQIGVGSDAVDLSGNCGNILSGVGPFALDEGMVKTQPGQTEIDVRIYNTNTGRTIVETIQVTEDGKFEEHGTYSMAGVKGTASEIKIAFVHPAGSMTGKLFPTGSRQESLLVTTAPGLEPFSVLATLCDAANPFVLIEHSSMPQAWHDLDRNSTTSLDLAEAIRCTGAVKMGLATSISAAHEVRGTPKIAILSPTLTAISHSSNSALKHPADVSITAYTMGKPHPSFQLTGAVCLSSAVAVPGTIAHDLAKKREVLTPPETPPSCSVDGDGDEKVGDGRVVKRVVTIAHPSGELSTLVEMWEGMDGEVEVRSVSVSRTARRIFEGNVLFAL